MGFEAPERQLRLAPEHTCLTDIFFTSHRHLYDNRQIMMCCNRNDQMKGKRHRMHAKLFVVVCGSLLCLLSAQAAETNLAVRESATLQLSVDLIDGSRVIGIPVIATVPVETSYAKMNVPLKQIRTLKIGEDHETATLDLQNGDKLKGVITLGPIKMQTVFGPVAIGTGLLQELRVLLPGGALPESLRKGLVLYYTFDTAGGPSSIDQSGQGNHGSVEGAVWVPAGKNGGGYRFSDKGQVIRAPGPRELGSSYTISTWVSFDHFNNNYPHILADSDYTFVLAGQGPAYAPDQQQRVSFYSGYDVKVRAYHMVSAPMHVSTWVAVLVVVAKDQSFLYANGVEVAHLTEQRPRAASGLNGLLIGNSDIAKLGKDQQFNGLMDEVMVWNRALSADEVKQLYDAQK